MTHDSAELDLEDVHRKLSAACFNRTWTLIDKTERTPEETEEMIHAAHASAWHWMKRPDNLPRRRSVGCWLLSRVYSLVDRPDEARHYAKLSARSAVSEPPFYRAYALEALARAEQRAGNDVEARRLVVEARELARTVEKPEDQKLLLDDLDTLFR